MFNTQTKQSAFFTLFISAVLALSLTSCKNNSEKHTEQKSETIVKNKVKDLNIPPQCGLCKAKDGQYYKPKLFKYYNQ